MNSPFPWSNDSLNMTTVILDPHLAERLRADRAARGIDCWDEVWEGIYMMAPARNNEHQQLVSGLLSILQDVVGWPGIGRVFPGINVSDRSDDWERNYRIPDISVFLNDTTAVDRGSYWQGGPDLAVEVVSPGDQSRAKLDFYASVHTRELLILDREPWQLEFYRLSSNSLELIETIRPSDGKSVQCDTVGLTFELRPSEIDDRPSLIVTHPDSGRDWKI